MGLVTKFEAGKWIGTQIPGDQAAASMASPQASQACLRKKVEPHRVLDDKTREVSVAVQHAHPYCLHGLSEHASLLL